MRSFTIIISILMLLAIPVKGQVNIDFENGLDSSWFQDPPNRWSADTVEAIEGHMSLRQIYDNAVSDNDRISMPLKNLVVDSAELRVHFMLRHGYSPSSSNKWSIYLYADQDATKMKSGELISGYVIGVNYSGTDDLLKLWKIKNGNSSIIIETSLNWQNQIGLGESLEIEVKRSQEGLWSILADTSGVIGSFSLLGETADAELKEANFFGLSYSYSATKDRLLWFDNLSIEGAFLIDTVPPDLQSLNIMSPRSLELLFSENITCDSAKFQIEDSGSSPDSIVCSGSTCTLYFKEIFPTDENLNLTLTGISDLSGNTIDTLTTTFLFHQPIHGDIVINELMVDPTPSVSLPEAEYIELFNTTGFLLNLEGWKLEVGNSKWTLPELKIPSLGYALITSPSAEKLFTPGIPVAGILSGSGSLANTGSLVVLRDPGGALMSAVHYTDSWYKDDQKKNGGWSLERMLPYFSCTMEDYWTASYSWEGGTPGKENANVQTYFDNEEPTTKRMAPVNDSTLLLSFNEPMDSASVCDISFYELSREYGSPYLVVPVEPESRDVYLYFKNKMMKDTPYKLTVYGGIQDCSGNPINGDIIMNFAVAEQADSLDVLFSEILYDVPEGGREFVELYNHSTHAVDLSKLTFSVLRTGSDEIQTSAKLSQSPYILFPGGYGAAAAQPDFLYDFYTIENPEGLVDSPFLPALSNSGGCAILQNENKKIIDKMCWSDEMHHPLLSNTQGVSLERTNFEGNTLDAFNWHSASSVAGYATPGYENSQETETGIQDQRIKIVPELITPDNDGRDDFAQICINMGEPGWIAQVQVYDMAGRLVKEILNNALTGTENRISWDGSDNRGTICYNGIYIIRISLFHLKGAKYETKKVCVISLK